MQRHSSVPTVTTAQRHSGVPTTTVAGGQQESQGQSEQGQGRGWARPTVSLGLALLGVLDPEISLLRVGVGLVRPYARG